MDNWTLHSKLSKQRQWAWDLHYYSPPLRRLELIEPREKEKQPMQLKLYSKPVASFSNFK